MPPRLRGSLQRSLSCLDSGRVFFCPSCATWRRSFSTRANVNSRRGDLLPSSSSTHRHLTTSSVINAGRDVPPRFKELHEALNLVGKNAAGQISVSRLQLALRGLESDEPLVRVAVLGLNDATAARKLVRLLLADPLTPRGSWEDILDSYDADTSQGLLIRYGESSEKLSNNLLPTISVPSPILKRANLEILVAGLGAQGAPEGSHFTAETFLVPTVTIQTSHSGRHNVIRYPVHKSIICGSGVDGLLAYCGLMSRSDLKYEAKSVHGAIELSVADKNRGNERVAFVDIDKADEALSKFRESVQNVSAYEQGWNNSGVQPVVDWLSSLKGVEGDLDASLKSLILSLLDSAEEGAFSKENQKLQEQIAQSVSDQTRESLDGSVTSWAEKAHSELRSSLEEGFSSQRWRGLAWWKLFWRVDDVGMVTSEILERKYLRQAEREVIWTAGRLQQAGLLEESRDDNPNLTAEGSSKPSLVEPTQISASRTRLLNTTVPALQALAQKLVLFSISTTTLTSSLSILTYLSFPSASVSEACTAAAVGLIYSLRRQQTKWETARTYWENEVREDGRTTLRETEDLLRTVIREGGRQEEDVTEQEARESIEKARNLLEEVK
ncbi:hypothetical protein PHISCL_08081 [Aspergillus sclerotialis]|uniref:Mmc1 C-terminal domain-containing protein n=1 Tax=Aspergillus sclerotialis TaxID=2070753 RepID=A0A3A2ZRA6_9EURO|nr:hypothetical protein PHISCL_08081 [Aspergillus sclerotialis]